MPLYLPLLIALRTSTFLAFALFAVLFACPLVAESIPSPEEAAQARSQAEQGDADAQWDLAKMYISGQGMPQDDSKGVEWMRKSAQNGNADAQAALALRYGMGVGVPQDQSEGVKWWQKAAEQRKPVAQYSLGLIYYNGAGIPKDYVQAYMWADLAAEQDYPLASGLRDTIKKSMTPEQIAEGTRLVNEWGDKHPRTIGYRVGQLIVGLILLGVAVLVIRFIRYMWGD